MTNCLLRHGVSMMLIVCILLSCFSATAFAQDSTESAASTETADATEEIAEQTVQPMEEPAEPTVQPTEETTEPTAPSTEATAPSELPTEETESPTEETVSAEEPTEETTVPPTEETTEPTAPPTEEPTEPIIPPTEEMTEPTEPEVQPMTEDAEKPEKRNENLYFGQLHAHSALSSGTETSEALFAYAREEGMDFFAITDHSDSFDDAASAGLGDAAVSQAWSEGKAAAVAATGDDFLGIYGFELSWPERLQLGHMSVFNTSGFASWEQYRSYASGLQNWYDTLAAVPEAVVQWNHPGNQYGTFSDFAHYSPEADREIHLMEAGGSYEKYYSRALDKGWHIAPANNEGSGRTVIHARSLTEPALYEAIRNHQVYATQDSDLEIFYALDGYPMGSALKKRYTGETADILVELYDPTDGAIGLVEVIVDGGKTSARQTVSTPEAAIGFPLPADHPYYYLRITQPDGDVAITAPVWVEESGELEISGLTCQTAVPVQNEAVTLVLDVCNREKADFLVESLILMADGTTVLEDDTLSAIPAGRELAHSLTFRYDGIGQTEITTVLSGMLDGEPREYTVSLPLSFRLSGQVTQILVDGSHGNAGLSDLGLLKAMAAEEDICITVAEDGITEELLKTCRFLMVTAPSTPFSQTFLDAVCEYVQSGGSLLVCGQPAGQGVKELNRLLEAAGATLQLNEDTLTDSLYNGGEESLLYLGEIDTGSSWCENMTEGQVYRHAGGCSVNPGQGHVLVRSGTGAALVWEETEAGGAVFAAGSLLFGDAELKEPANIWDAPYANRTIAENLLGIGGETLSLSTICQAREGTAGSLHRIRGYVTAGTANSHAGFPNTLYLQDDTGGIAIVPFAAEGIAVGTPVEITGAAATQNGNRILKPVSHKVLDGDLYRYLPKTGDWKTLLDPELHGGELVQVEGECTKVELTADGLVSGIRLKDSSGNTASIVIEDGISSAATGENDLHEEIQKGGTVRTIGILHVDAAGNPVIRVRNCEEVVYIPPKTTPKPNSDPGEEYVNPDTGDWLFCFLK